jgi:hypothetical protein
VVEARDLDPVLVVETPLELFRIARREPDREHLAELARDRRQAGLGDEALDERVAVRPHLVPAPLALELDRGRHGEPRRGIARPLPAVARRELLNPPAQLTTSGSTRSWSSGRTQRNPAPFGEQSHLWQVPA